MNDFDYWNIIKWIIIVLLAGFIGQFERASPNTLWQRERTYEKKSPWTTRDNRSFQINNDSPADSPLTVNDNKSYPDLAGDVAKESTNQEKKALKTLEKQKKKEAKRLKKEGE